MLHQRELALVAGGVKAGPRHGPERASRQRSGIGPQWDRRQSFGVGAGGHGARLLIGSTCRMARREAVGALRVTDYFPASADRCPLCTDLRTQAGLRAKSAEGQDRPNAFAATTSLLDHLIGDSE